VKAEKPDFYNGEVMPAGAIEEIGVPECGVFACGAETEVVHRHHDGLGTVNNTGSCNDEASARKQRDGGRAPFGKLFGATLLSAAHFENN